MMIDGKLMWERENKTWGEDFTEALERYAKKFGEKANFIEVHSSLDPSQFSIEGVTVVKSPVVPSKNTFYVYRR